MRKIFGRMLAAAAAGAMLLSFSGCDNSGKDYMEMDLSQYLTLGQYKGLSVDLVDYNTTATEIQSVIENDFAGYTTQTEILRRAIKKDDNVIVSWTATINGGAFTGNKAEDYLLKIGLSPYEAARNDLNSFPELEEALIGRVSGDEFSLMLTYPDDYADNPELAGQTAEFNVKIEKVYVIMMPEMTEDLLYEVTGYKNYEEYYQDKVDEINKYYDDLIVSDAKKKLWVKACENAELIKNPKKKFQEEYDEARQYYVDLANQYDMKLGEMLEQLGITEKELSDNCNEQAAGIVFEDLVFYSIVKAENIALDEKEYQTRAEEYAKDLEIVLYQLEAQYGYDGVYEVLLYDKVLDFLYENNTVNVTTTG